MCCVCHLSSATFSRKGPIGTHKSLIRVWSLIGASFGFCAQEGPNLFGLQLKQQLALNSVPTASQSACWGLICNISRSHSHAAKQVGFLLCYWNSVPMELSNLQQAKERQSWDLNPSLGFQSLESFQHSAKSRHKLFKCMFKILLYYYYYSSSKCQRCA